MSIPNTLPTLSAGAHRPYEGKACVMEYVSLLAGEEWSDTPSCTYRPLARAAQLVNDRLSDDARHLLVPLIGRLFGTTLPVDDRLFALRVPRTVVSPVFYADRDLVAWLESVIDIYDELSGRTEHREITDAELTELALAVRR